MVHLNLLVDCQNKGALNKVCQFQWRKKRHGPIAMVEVLNCAPAPQLQCWKTHLTMGIRAWDQHCNWGAGRRRF